MYVKGYCIIERVVPNVNCYIEMRDVIEGDVVEYIIDTDSSDVKHIQCYINVRRFNNEMGTLVCSTKMHFEQFCNRFVEQITFDRMKRFSKNRVNFIVRSVDNSKCCVE